MKADLSCLFVKFMSDDDYISLPIAAIKAMCPDPDEPYKTRIKLKEGYFFNGLFEIIAGYPLETVQTDINQTIIDALKELGEEA